jgi:ABC-type Fe3+-hydroxamate transport system substrate-binding protein
MVPLIIILSLFRTYAVTNRCVHQKYYVQVNDQLKRTIIIDAGKRQRIISLVPSQTELLFDLGLDEEVVGITKFCIHPKEKVAQKEKVGGTKNLNIEKIKALNPTLIIANKEENNKEQIEELAKAFPVWISDVTDLQSALEMIAAVGKMTGKEKEAEELSNNISKAFASYAPLRETKNTAYFIWQKPLMVAGNNTFIKDMLHHCGFKNCFENLNGHYPEISATQLQQANPEVILLSSEPFPFHEKHVKDFQKICPAAKVVLVDGELFSWYGSRLLHAPSYFQKLAESLRP